jgi:hypothetical protein
MDCLVWGQDWMFKYYLEYHCPFFNYTPEFSSVLRQVQRGTARLPQSWRSSAKTIPFPSRRGLQLKKSNPIPLGSTPRHPSKQTSFRKGQTSWRVDFPASSNRPYSERVKDFNQDSKPVIMSISPVTIFKSPFFQPQLCISYAGMVWFSKRRRLALAQDPPLAFW